MKPVLVFDVNETLLDIDHLAPFFAEAFGDARVMRGWFAELILYSQTLTLAGRYLPFGALGLAALDMVAEIHDTRLSDAQKQAFTTRMGSLPAHPDVAPALARLQEGGFRMVTLTNSAPAANPPLEKAGLAPYFEKHFSVDPHGQYKPAAATYTETARALDTDIANLCLIACHFWDTIGMQAQGGQAAFLTRPGNAPLKGENIPQPDFIAADLGQLTDQFLVRFP